MHIGLGSSGSLVVGITVRRDEHHPGLAAVAWSALRRRRRVVEARVPTHAIVGTAVVVDAVVRLEQYGLVPLQVGEVPVRVILRVHSGREVVVCTEGDDAAVRAVGVELVWRAHGVQV